MKQLNITIDKKTHNDIKVEAAKRDVSIKDFILKAVEEFLKKEN